MRYLRRSPSAIGPRSRVRQYSERRRLWLQALEDRSVPAVFTVPTTADTGALGDTTTLTGELRWAISTANDEINFPGPDIINITATGTMTLAAGEMSISTPMTINGPGANLFTIDGGGASRIFNVNDGVNGTAMPLAISKVTMTNGSAGAGPGGAMYLRDEDLTLTNCTVSKSSAGSYGGGIYFFVQGKLTMRGCTISGNSAGTDGGGLYTNGAAQWLIENSTISGNTAGTRGGGFAVIAWAAPGTFTMRFSTVTANKASSVTSTGGGGGMRFTPGGPAITIESSIVSGNTNPGGSAPDIRTSTVYLSNSAVGSPLGWVYSDKGGNLAFGTDIKLGPLANNGGPTQTHLPMGGSPLRNAGGAVGLLTMDQRGQPRPQDLIADIGSVESPADPTPSAKLVPVPNIATPGTTPNSVTITYSDSQSNISLATIDPTDIEIVAPDGKTKLPITGVTTDKLTDSTPINATYTFTVPSGKWSTANVGLYTVNILAGAVSDTDLPTPNKNPASSGSFRNTIPQVFTVDIAIDENDGNTSPGDLSLREALILANGNPGSADTIRFDPTVFATQKTVTLTLGSLPVSDLVTITGPAASVVIDGNAADRVMKIDIPGIGNAVNISNMIFQNGKLTGTSNADPNNFGGGIYVEDESVTITNCEIRNNTAFGTGGGIYLRSNGSTTTPGSLTILDSKIMNNTSTGSGGFRLGSGAGVSIDNVGSLTIQRTTVSGNNATTQGGGVYFVVSGSMDMSQCLISGNIAQGGAGGGGFYFYGTVVSGLKITNSTISGNKATIGPGGGIALNTINGTSQLQIRNSSIVFNESSLGGGISKSLGSSTIPLSISSSIVANNIVSGASGRDINMDLATDIPGNNNFIGIAGDGNFVMTGANNIVGDPFTPQDPLLDPVLANNGGPTLTHKLMPTSTAIDAGIANSLTSDQRGGAAVRVFNDPLVMNGPGSDGTDMGAFENQPVVAPTVTKVEINGGAIQRSMVTTATVTFSEAVSFPNGILSAFQLNRHANGSTGLVNLNAVQSGNTVTLTFVGGGAVGIDPGGSLQDGTYQLTIVASKVQGGLAVQATDTISKTHRLFGDADGTGSVTAIDFNAFRLEYGSTGNSIFDFDGSGTVTSSDFNQFRTRYGLSGYLP